MFLVVLLTWGQLAISLGLPPTTRPPVECTQWYDANPMPASQTRSSRQPGYQPRSFPSSAMRAGLEGEVTLIFDVDPQGRVGAIRAGARRGDQLFEASARDDLRQWL